MCKSCHEAYEKIMILMSELEIHSVQVDKNQEIIGNTFTNILWDFDSIQEEEFNQLAEEGYDEYIEQKHPGHKQQMEQMDARYHDDIDYDTFDPPFCEACQQVPCLCSDRKSSTVYDD